MSIPSAPKRLITGPAGSGKTTFVLEAVRARIDAAEEVLCLLPTYGQVEHTKRRFLRSVESGAIFDPPLLTFTGLYERLANGKKVRHLAGRVVRRRLMERAIEAVNASLFAGVSSTPGFRDQALAVVKEIRECGLGVGELRDEVAKRLPEGTPSAERVTAFTEIAIRYDALLVEAGLQDHEGALVEVRDSLLSGGMGNPPRLLFVDGFANFTRVEFQILEALIERADETVVTLPGEEGRSEGVFRLASETRRALLEAGFREMVLAADRRSRGDDLRLVNEHLFGAAGERPPCRGQVRRIIAADRASEVEEIAREIGRLLRGDEPDLDPAPSLREIGIIVRGLEAYRDLIPTVFARHRIPVRIVQDPLPLRSEPILRHALAVFDAVARPWEVDADAFVRFLGSGHVRLAGGCPDPASARALRMAAARVDEQVREFGPPGTLDEMFRRLDRTMAGSSSLSPLRSALDRVGKACAKKRPPAELASELERLLDETIAPSFEARGGDLGDESLLWQGPLFWADRFGREAAALAALRGALREAGSEAAWGEPGVEVGAADLVDAVRETLFDDTAPVRDRRLNCVNVIDAREARHWESLRVVVVAGLIEKEFPSYPQEDIFIRDPEREALSEGGKLRLREHLRQRDEERYLFYMAATRPRDRLYLSHPSHDTDGKPLPTSFYVGDTLALFEPESVPTRRISLARPLPPPEEASTREELERSIAQAIGSGGSERIAAEAIARLAPSPEIFRTPRDYLRGGGDPLDDPTSLETILAATRVLSPTALGAAIRCPQLFFVSRLLRLREPPKSHEDLLDPMDIGGIAHRVLERTLREGSPEPLESLIRAEVDEVIGKVEPGPRLEIALRDLEAWIDWTLTREREALGPFRAVSFERKFDENDGVTLPVSGEPVLLKGKIDRIDVGDVDGESHAIAVDYKLSRGFVKDAKKAILDHTDVQLPVYLHAIRRILGHVPAGLELFPISKKARGGIYLEEIEDDLGARLETKRSVFHSREDFESEIDAALARAAAAVERVRAGVTSREPLDPTGCTPDGCDAFLICRPNVDLLRPAPAGEDEE